MLKQIFKSDAVWVRSGKMYKWTLEVQVKCASKIFEFIAVECMSRCMSLMYEWALDVQVKYASEIFELAAVGCVSQRAAKYLMGE